MTQTNTLRRLSGKRKASKSLHWILARLRAASVTGPLGPPLILGRSPRHDPIKKGQFTIVREILDRKNMREIPNAELKEADLPPPDADWSTIGRFALTFNGYAYWGSFEKCGDVANRWAEAWRKRRHLPHSLTDLRTCLFFEQRCWHHYGRSPDEESMRYVHALVEAIRDRIVRNARY